MNNNTQNTSPSTFLRTQSYIVNGKPNPLSQISRKKFFSKYINKFSRRGNITKNNNNKFYISDIKKLKKKKSSSTKKIHNFIKKKEEDKKEINNFYLSSNDLFSNNINLKETKNTKQNNFNKSFIKEKECISNDNEKEKYTNGNKKQKIFFINKLKDKTKKLPIYSLELAHKNNINKMKLTDNEKNNNISSDISNLINNFHNNRVLTEANMNYISTNKDYDNDINIKYNLTYSEKINKNKRIINSVDKNNLINKNKTKEQLKLM